MTPAFEYPRQPHERRHGPQGYRDYQSFGPWLRDEFGFRCVYCLQREAWGRRIGAFELDHFHPTSAAPDLELEYDNLVYACSCCNSIKQSLSVPNPDQMAFGDLVEVFNDGTIAPNEANQRVKSYGLTRADYRRITEKIPNISRAIPMRELRLDNRTADTKLVGCVEDYLTFNRLQIARGRWLKKRDRGEKVVVLADDTAKRLFPFEDPIGRSFWVGSEFYTVIGQTKPRTASAAIGGSLDSRDYNLDAYIPLETATRGRLGHEARGRRTSTQRTNEGRRSICSLVHRHADCRGPAGRVLRRLEWLISST